VGVSSVSFSIFSETTNVRVLVDFQQCLGLNLLFYVFYLCFIIVARGLRETQRGLDRETTTFFVFTHPIAPFVDWEYCIDYC
jgi:hypothetical protein